MFVNVNSCGEYDRSVRDHRSTRSGVEEALDAVKDSLKGWEDEGSREMVKLVVLGPAAPYTQTDEPVKLTNACAPSTVV